jgi:YrbI family 3-deoxy-D-manno-octulosonate 8-phosphate phosphatase
LPSTEFATRIAALRLVVFDFDGVFTDNAVYVFEDGREAVRCYRGDGLGLRDLERAGLIPIILSTETNPVVRARAAKLRVRCISGVENKLQTLKVLQDELHVTMAQTAFVGNDVNDAACLRAVGLAIVVQDAHPSVIPLAHYQTAARGGYGAVREVCDLVAGVVGGEKPLYERG